MLLHSAHSADDSLSDWRDVLGQLSQLLGQRPPDEVCCDGLTPRQCQVLRILVEQEGMRLTELALQVGVTPSGLTRQLDRLESLQLIQRVRGVGEDGRAAAVVVTARGRSIKTRLDQTRLNVATAVVEALPEAQRSVVLSSLRLLVQVLNHPGCCNTPLDPSCHPMKEA